MDIEMARSTRSFAAIVVDAGGGGGRGGVEWHTWQE